MGTDILRFSPASPMAADSNQPLDTLRALRQCALTALLLVIGAFPDVIFFGASLSLVNSLNVTLEPAPS